MSIRRARDRTAGLDPASTDWFAWLTEADRKSCRAELAAARAVGAGADGIPYQKLWSQWRATAEICSDPELLSELRQSNDFPEARELPELDIFPPWADKSL